MLVEVGVPDLVLVDEGVGVCVGVVVGVGVCVGVVVADTELRRRIRNGPLWGPGRMFRGGNTLAYNRRSMCVTDVEEMDHA